MARWYALQGLIVALLLAGGLCGLRLPAEDGPAANANPPLNPAVGSVQDALQQPFDFPFAKPTRIGDVAKILSKSLNAPVALDRAALDRQDVKEDDEVQLDLRRIRLKTGLKLLLDQLDLTYRVEAEDNLLVITDKTGSENPVDLVLEQIKALHKDVHDLQDSLDDVRAPLGLDGEREAKLRKPTIIEELPRDANEKEKPKSKEVPPASTPVRPRAGI